MTIAIINYGLGNLHSVQKAVIAVGGETVITSDPDTILAADKVILPGVGTFRDGMQELRARGLIPVLSQFAAEGKPFLGICLGMQLLFTEGYELGRHLGLCLLPGRVAAFEGPDVKIPQIGWNQVQIERPEPLLDGIQNQDYFYFNHSYFCMPENSSVAITTTEYGVRFVSAVQEANLMGVQFHPEKSQKAGLRVLHNFVEMDNA